ncbi:MAG TPA: hypothetical protein VHP36_09600 [Chitinispirillaceae bacterium]|nr:hypothetical protein [Chitinispirillaceae bacterium]
MIGEAFQNPKFFFLQVFLLIALMAGAFLVPEAIAAIDETMPAVASIPKEIIDDWKAQGGTAAEIKASLPAEYQSKCDGSFESACHWRRVYRMKQFPQMQSILFAKHHNIGSTAVGFWVNVGPSDVTDANFATKGSLCLLKFENYYSQFKEILTKTDMAVKDPCISLDGKKVVFAMSSGKGKGWLLYEMEIDKPGSVKQLTKNPSGLTVADFEPCYLPNGDIMFSSTRCFGVIDCGWQPTSNMFVMDSVGNYIRRVAYDQVHTDYPVLCPDGTVLYTRWEYNDRDVSNVMGLFSMFPDGSHQIEVYGNQTTWPQSFIHGRPVPGNPNKFFAIASGHHGEYSGEAFVIDASKATNGPEYVKMISPPRETKSRDKDEWALGGVFRNSEYPNPLSEEWYLVSYRDENKLPSFNSISTGKYRIYLKHIDGKSQELIAWADQSLHRPVLVASWKDIWGSEPFRIAEQANFNDSMATFTMNDVYFGAGMSGIDKNTKVAKSLRVIALNYRVSGACNSGVFGSLSGLKPSGVVFSAPTLCPVAFGGGSWEAKRVLGEAKIYDDGSAAFKVPARVPLYFEVLDSNGFMIAGMRSWSTLMPGETFSCYGCHENRKAALPTPKTNLARDAGVQKVLDKPLGVEDQPFDYAKFVQPILEKNCVSCHGANHKSGFDLRGDKASYPGAKKSWTRSYSSLTDNLKTKLTPEIGVIGSNKAICITTIFSQPPQMPPYSYGSTKSGMIQILQKGHQNVKLSAKDLKILACWIDLECPHDGTYNGSMSTTDSQKYQQLEQTAQKWYTVESDNVKAYAATQKQVAVIPDNYSVEKAAYIARHFSIRYQPAARSLILKNCSQGNLILVDLRGKVVSRVNLTDIHPNGSYTVSLPASLSTGLYIVKIKGVKEIEQAKVTITK